VRGFVAPTDHGWYRFLQARPELREVNFWRPSQSRFGAVNPGELFFFKLKAPHNAIGGFGVFTRAAVLPVWEAWDVFGAANGTADVYELVARLKRLSGQAGSDFTLDDWIGCLAINEPVFFPPDEWVPAPSDWRREIVSGKTYDLTQGEGRLLYERCLEAAGRSAMTEGIDMPDLEERYGAAQLVRPRLGQASFRLAVLDAYQRRCSVTGERSLPVVEAAHIKPYSAGGEHRVSNGITLRRDFHRLFDLGFVSVRPDQTLAVSKDLREQYENGRVYYELEGHPVRTPSSAYESPDSELLEWHYEEIYRG
jgi:putative restriction endonuclease